MAGPPVKRVACGTQRPCRCRDTVGTATPILPPVDRWRGRTSCEPSDAAVIERSMPRRWHSSSSASRGVDPARPRRRAARRRERPGRWLLRHRRVPKRRDRAPAPARPDRRRPSTATCSPGRSSDAGTVGQGEGQRPAVRELRGPSSASRSIPTSCAAARQGLADGAAAIAALAAQGALPVRLDRDTALEALAQLKATIDRAADQRVPRSRGPRRSTTTGPASAIDVFGSLPRSRPPRASGAAAIELADVARAGADHPRRPRHRRHLARARHTTTTSSRSPTSDRNFNLKLAASQAQRLRDEARRGVVVQRHRRRAHRRRRATRSPT